MRAAQTSTVDKRAALFECCDIFIDNNDDAWAFIAANAPSAKRRIVVSDDDAYMTVGELCKRCRVSRSWVERKSRDELLPFPQPLQFSGETSARRWRRASVITWEVARAKINGSAS
jgi:predicted DNA-binding transcriptional regulator AlpA